MNERKGIPNAPAQFEQLDLYRAGPLNDAECFLGSCFSMLCLRGSAKKSPLRGDNPITLDSSAVFPGWRERFCSHESLTLVSVLARGYRGQRCLKRCFPTGGSRPEKVSRVRSDGTQTKQ